MKTIDLRTTLLAAFAALLFVLPAAHAEQKNVKLLTGLSDLELQRTMNLMRASLGVHCDYCHVVSDKGAWDFASDAKPPKLRGREMLAMVAGINTGSFGGRPMVSCNTCHRGQIRPVSLIALPQTPPPFPTPKPASPAMPTVRDLRDKYAAAIGDASLLKSRIAKGTRTNFDGKAVWPIVVTENGMKVRIAATTPQGSIEQAFDGTGGWLRNDKGTRAFTPAELENFQSQAAAYALTLPDQVSYDAHVTGREKVGDHDAWRVSWGRTQTREVLYFDVTSGLPVRRLFVVATMAGELPQQTDFDDWRDVGGVKFPFRITASFIDPWVGSTRTYSEVQPGAKVTDETFAMPKP